GKIAMKCQYIRTMFVVLGFSLLCSFPSFGQFDAGQIAGFIQDASGAFVPGATIVATNEGNGEEHHAITNESGHYVFPNLVVGIYTISAQAKGFNTSVRKGVKLSAADHLSVDIPLTVGSVTQAVEVNASAARLQTESAQVSRTIESRQIQDLTLNGRNPIFLALLKPGVRGGSIGTFAPDDVTNGGFSINGGCAGGYVVTGGGAIAPPTPPSRPPPGRPGFGTNPGGAGSPPTTSS